VTCFLFGFGFIAIGIGLLANIIITSRHKYYHYTVKTFTVSVDETLIVQYLNFYWKELFPQEEIPCRVILTNNHLQVVAHLPGIEKEKQDDIVEQIKEDLRTLLDLTIGYNEEFELSLSFRERQKPLNNTL